ncbi:hypothetical protein AMJ52_04190 [candidate division TA06 bacterium DG_78]|uniref:FlgD Ig-like domain-containing protein n=1 Tax=candidate division TA06 bacterium DG_78 TaxID=1703772 RepID=A0A0S7YEF9_UNCT6|nr:MAG: hypothetical protein AMJ52_04190 [candidate division TA06 bacterium DG_78]
MEFLIALLLFSQETKTSEHDIGEEVIKGEATMKVEEQKIYLSPSFNVFAPLDSILLQEEYLFDEKLYMTIDALNTPILYLHSEYLRTPVIGRLMYGTIVLFVPSFKTTVSSWELVITDTNGDDVRKYAERGLPPTSISWDGRTDKDNMCNMGEVYNYTFTAFDAVGNPTRIVGHPYTFNGIIYDEQNTKIIAIAADVLFKKDSFKLTDEAVQYLDEVTNLIKEHFKREVVVYSYSESETLAKSRGETIMDKIIEETVLPKEAIKTSPRFIAGLKPKYSKIEIVIQ